MAEEKFTKHLLVRLPIDVRSWLKAAARNVNFRSAKSERFWKHGGCRMETSTGLKTEGEP